MTAAQTVPLRQIVREFNLQVFHQSTDFDTLNLRSATVNRPGLALVGFYDYFDSARLQMLGKMEYTYLSLMSREDRLTCFRNLMAHDIPAVVLTRALTPFPECVQAAKEYNCTILGSTQVTSELMSDLTTSLRSHLSPRITRHGVLMEVYGEGVLLMGESGIGKSEAAVELIKRGHRLIADDAVEIRRINPTTLVGSAPELIRYYVEMRGIGVIDVRQLFGMGAVKDEQNVDLIINLEQWKQGRIYDRLGMEDFHTEILDVNVPSLTIPIKPGRNLSIIIEVAAMNNRHKKMGYNAAQEFTDRLNRYFDDQMAAMEAKNGNNRN